MKEPWTPDSWKRFPAAQDVTYPDAEELAHAVATLRQLPPLVTSWEIERLKQHLADAQQGRRFILQGGDCAETLADCQPRFVSNKLKILLQMSLVLVHALQKPVVRVGRFAGQYAKPRSKPTETRRTSDGDIELPNYFGDLVNRSDFTPGARRADPNLLLEGYKHAALTMNFVRSLTEGGFADLHHPEYWDLSFFEHASLPDSLRRAYQETSQQISRALRFMEALGETGIDELQRVEFFTCHEGLNLHYESAQTRAVPRREGYWDLTTHLPWIGERTRQLDGAHVEFFRGIRNPVGVKIGPTCTPEELLRTIDALNPQDEAGKLVLITRMGAARVADGLPPLIEAVQREGRTVLWIADPMHGNTHTTTRGIKTRSFEDILREVQIAMDVHDGLGSIFGGVHFELTGDDVTECIGGAAGVREEDLHQNYATACDPRLNYRQALEMAFSVARHYQAAGSQTPD